MLAADHFSFPAFSGCLVYHELTEAMLHYLIEGADNDFDSTTIVRMRIFSNLTIEQTQIFLFYEPILSATEPDDPAYIEARTGLLADLRSLRLGPPPVIRMEEEIEERHPLLPRMQELHDD